MNQATGLRARVAEQCRQQAAIYRKAAEPLETDSSFEKGLLRGWLACAEWLEGFAGRLERGE